MPFYATGDQQVRLRFSRYTEEILKNDMFLFGEARENTFINQVIRNYYPDARASIHMRLEEYENTLSKSLPPDLSAKSSRAFLEELAAIEEERLKMLPLSYEKPVKGCKSKPYRLQNDLYCEFTDGSSDFQENMYYDSLSHYIKTLMEEYAHEPYIRREQIYFKKTFDEIGEAIAAKKQLLITVSSGDSFYTIPYKVLSDPLTTTNYLTGYSYAPENGKDAKYPASYKIAAIRKIRIQKSRSGVLHSVEESVLLQNISERGVQFLVSDYAEVKVRFTGEGMRSFERWLHLRPAPFLTMKRESDYILTFHCSLHQARAYFFKFGAMAEILSPRSLREEFAAQYAEACARYMA